jgi:hypothetical protein
MSSPYAMVHKNSGPWNMPDEFTFIDHLGCWTNSQPLSVGRKLDLLYGYRKGLDLRTDWGNLNRHEIEAYVNREIARLTELPLSQIL